MSAIDDAFQRMHEHNLAVAREAELTGAVNTLTRIVESLAAKLDHELAELRVQVEQIDYEKVPRAAFEELHTRVDNIESEARNMLGAYTAHLRHTHGDAA